jgi:hypothetical protein
LTFPSSVLGRAHTLYSQFSPSRAVILPSVDVLEAFEQCSVFSSLLHSAIVLQITSTVTFKYHTLQVRTGFDRVLSNSNASCCRMTPDYVYLPTKCGRSQQVSSRPTVHHFFISSHRQTPHCHKLGHDRFLPTFLKLIIHVEYFLTSLVI